MTIPTRLRSQLLGTQVLDKDTAVRIGVVNQLWLELDPLEVRILAVSDKLVGRSYQALELEAISVIGPDALLVSEDVLLDSEMAAGLVKLIGSDVTTETGIKLGKVKDFEFRIDTGELTALILSNLGVPLVPGFIASTFKLGVDDIVSIEATKITTRPGTEDRLERLKTSVLEQVGLVKPAWLVAIETPSLPSAAESLIDEEEFDEEYDVEATAVAETTPSPEPLEEIAETEVPPAVAEVFTAEPSVDAPTVETVTEEIAEALPTEEVSTFVNEASELIGETTDIVAEAAEDPFEPVVEVATDVAEAASDAGEDAVARTEALLGWNTDASEGSNVEDAQEHLSEESQERPEDEPGQHHNY